MYKGYVDCLIIDLHTVSFFAITKINLLHMTLTMFVTGSCNCCFIPSIRSLNYRTSPSN